MSLDMWLIFFNTSQSPDLRFLKKKKNVKKKKLSSPELKTTHSREIASLSKRAATEDESGRPDGTSPKSFLDLSIWSRARRKHLQEGLWGNSDGDWENLPSVTFKQTNRVFDVAWFGILIAGVAAWWKLTASQRSKVQKNAQMGWCCPVLPALLS